jgi:hypothetical protein
MAKVILQETYDTVIQENIVEFGMSGEWEGEFSGAISESSNHSS